MSIRDGLEPSRSPDSDTHTQPLPRDPRDPAADPQPQPPEAPRPGPAHETWPPSWGQSPSSQGQAPAPADGPAWTQPKAAQGPSWTQPTGPGAAGATPMQPTGSDADSPRTQPPGSDAGPSWSQPKGPEPRADQPQPGWGEGGGHPTVPAWGTRPADPGSPRGRRPSRWLAGAVAGVVLLAAGYGIREATDNDSPAPAGAGIPTAAPIAAAPAPSGEEPAAAVARTLLPTVVEIRHGSGVGSGFVYDSNGYIMTAAHVIEGVDEVSVRLYDGTRLRGEVVGTDVPNDVGVVKVDRTGLKAAPLAVGQTTQVGQLAVAIGSPFGLNETVTAGIVSSTDRLLDDGREVLQTDAPINPGNSGGVLANRQGRVIGINSAIRPADESNGNIGIGFAVPIDIAARSAEAIVEGKPVQIGYLGVQMAPPTGNQDGVLVQVVTAGSPADQAGLRVGDLVVAIDGRAVATTGELGARIRAHKPGDKITLKVVRDGNETTVTASLTQRPAG